MSSYSLDVKSRILNAQNPHYLDHPDKPGDDKVQLDHPDKPGDDKVQLDSPVKQGNDKLLRDNENLLRLKTRGFNHLRDGYQIILPIFQWALVTLR